MSELLESSTDAEDTAYPFCVNCAFIGTNPSYDWTQFRCFAPQNIKERRRNPVTGNEEVFFVYDACSLARAGGCGISAIWFKEKASPPDEYNTPHTRNKSTLGVGDIDALLKRLEQSKKET